jgi:hypothetical protein
MSPWSASAFRVYNNLTTPTNKSFVGRRPEEAKAGWAGVSTVDLQSVDPNAGTPNRFIVAFSSTDHSPPARTPSPRGASR